MRACADRDTVERSPLTVADAYCHMADFRRHVSVSVSVSVAVSVTVSVKTVSAQAVHAVAAGAYARQ